MTQLDVGERGAKRQSWHRANPRDLLKRIIEANPGAAEAQLQKLFLRTLKDEEDEYFETIVDYWFGNNYRSLVHPVGHPPSRSKPAHAAALKETSAIVKEAVIGHVNRKATLLLLDLVLPTGKKLRNSTGADIADLATKIGGWFVLIAEKVNPGQKVGDVLSEEQVRALYDQ